MILNKKQTGLGLGLLFGFMHLMWVLAVALGIAQSLIDMMLNYHFISASKTVTMVNLGSGLMGVVGAFICGYIVGWFFALFFNLASKKSQ
ncbi:MAG: hypothetical protein US50_C0016G0022 [Candidatus Nomurabacteria bacterium GW2011_GWB1_37_5]|uniref:Uncharacterized protein n=1 Tax=Candidatus Nomurabacteria bacterium GW2011_GWB1_37_5 TaxID=1618742 RepID=A0A0G0GZE0_9BACT|nr:MAG: hypothetical protein US50_C0016G0022 [Candidatus Nomurabacteria bacterium GW2011_GWB1_37_5]